MNCDIVIVGAGIVGAAIAWQLQQRYPDKKIVILEKEAIPAQHQTGRNSGVVHAGVYYEPGSLKADFCKRGLMETLQFAREHHVPYEQCGKLLVATNELELQRMSALNQRCQINGIETQVLDKQELQEQAPNIHGLGAIHVKATAIIDYKKMTECLLQTYISRGGEVFYQQEVNHISENDSYITLNSQQGEIKTQYMIACAGLMADTLSRKQGLDINFRIIPFRGEYYRLHQRHGNLVKQLIYPIPDPRLPFLGVHITRMITGEITVGPNAVLGWKREGYDAFNFKFNDALNTIRWPGFWCLTTKYAMTGMTELLQSFSKYLYLRQLRKFTTMIEAEDLLPWPTGVRAQAVLKDGSLVHDFLFEETPRSLHVCNAPSPAATSAIPISEYVCDRFADKLN